MKKTRNLSVVAAIVASALAWPVASFAQVDAAAPQASAVPSSKPPPRLLTPAEKRDSATPPGDLRPEKRVTPQITIPLGRKPQPDIPASPPGGAPAAVSGVENGAANCQALGKDYERASCRAKLVREAGNRPPA